MAKMPRLVISGTHSGSGKTTVTVGLMAALGRRGFQINPFKVGPDYIDPMFHKLATGTVSRNLDTWMMGRTDVRRCFIEHSSGDLSIVEGVMGLYDGARPTSDKGSTAEIAKLLRAPVILVVDGEGMAGSAAAVVSGFRNLDKQVRIAGVIFNRVWGERHYDILRRAISRIKGVRSFGYLEPAPTLKIPERHLGLVPPEQQTRSRSWVTAAGKAVAKTVDLDALLRIAHAAPGMAGLRMPPVPPPKVRIAVAQDEAFNFYYADNLEALRRAGAEIATFSPLHDEELPENAKALIFGGGFPESFAEQLSRNGRMLSAVRSFVRSGGPVYAECGGLMYLAEELAEVGGTRHRMAGVIPGKVTIRAHLQNFGYAHAVSTRDTFLFKQGDKVRGHEFHHSTWSEEGHPECSLFEVHHAAGESRLEGFCLPNLHASYVHLHWRRHAQIAKRLVSAATGWIV